MIYFKYFHAHENKPNAKLHTYITRIVKEQRYDKKSMEKHIRYFFSNIHFTPFTFYLLHFFELTNKSKNKIQTHYKVDAISIIHNYLYDYTVIKT